MLLSGISWCLFWLFVVLLALAVAMIVYAVIHNIWGENLEIGELFVITGTIIAIIVGIVSAIALWLIVSGGIKADTINEDLRQKGYVVAKINLSDEQAQIVKNDGLEWVYLVKDAYDKWTPYVLCAISESRDNAACS